MFRASDSQANVFAETKYLVQSACDGYNVCIFAYGQTGSGKTFTIYGSDSDHGLTPRGISELFRIVECNYSKFSFSIKLYMLELYQDTLMDLLAPAKREEKVATARYQEGCSHWHGHSARGYDNRGHISKGSSWTRLLMVRKVDTQARRR